MLPFVGGVFFGFGAVCIAHWYVCGLTPLKLFEFFPAYVLGALKATFLDAYLGSMLTSAALGTDELEIAWNCLQGYSRSRR